MRSRTLRGDLRRAHRRVALAAALLLLLLAGAGVLIVHSRKGEEAALARRFDTRQATTARFIEAFVSDVFDRATGLAGRSFTGTVEPRIFDLAVADQGYSSAMLLDARGRPLASAPGDELPGGDLLGTYPHLRTAVEGRAAVSGVVPSAVQGTPEIVFAVPFQTPTGRRVFAGSYAVQTTPLATFVRNVIQLRTARVRLVDGAGVVLTGNQEDDPGHRIEQLEPLLGESSASGVELGSGSGRTYVTQSWLAGTNWRLVFTVRVSELYAPVNGSGRWIPWVGLGACALAAGAALALAHPYLVQRAQLIDSEGRRRAIIDTSADPFIGMGADGRVSDWNVAATRMLGYSAEEAVGRELAALIIPPEHRAAHRSGVRRFLATGETTLPETGLHVQALCRDGNRVDVELRLTRMEWQAGFQFHAFLRDISERLQHEATLRRLAMTDSLTGLANRRAAIERLGQSLARAQQTGTPVTVVFIDVDHFKSINDRHGHAAGDAVLIEVATRLRRTFRSDDLIARLGGDEFLVVCEDLAEGGDRDAVAARTHAVLALPYPVGDQLLQVTASVGISLSTGESTVEHLLAHADAQMYDAKASNRSGAAPHPRS